MPPPPPPTTATALTSLLHTLHLAPACRASTRAPRQAHTHTCACTSRVQIGSDGSATALRQFLQMCDVAVYEILGHEAAARDAAVIMAKQAVGP